MSLSSHSAGNRFSMSWDIKTAEIYSVNIFQVLLTSFNVILPIYSLKSYDATISMTVGFLKGRESRRVVELTVLSWKIRKDRKFPTFSLFLASRWVPTHVFCDISSINFWCSAHNFNIASVFVTILNSSDLGIGLLKTPKVSKSAWGFLTLLGSWVTPSTILTSSVFKCTKLLKCHYTRSTKTCKMFTFAYAPY